MLLVLLAVTIILKSTAKLMKNAIFCGNSNPFLTFSDSALLGYSDMDYPSKRKRCNTGKNSSSYFESMSQDDKLSAMFSKLSNIEATQDKMRSM